MDLSSLNENQKQAVTAPMGAILLLAGPGSGKTKTLTHRIAYIIEKKMVPPANILALTFTNKAAKEAVKVFLNGIRDSLKRGEKVVITGFGTFSVRSRKQRKGRNPKTGEAITISARKAPGFTPGKSLKKAVK